MKTYSASCCAALLILSSSLPLVSALAAEERKEERKAPQHQAPPRRNEQKQGQERAQQQAKEREGQERAQQQAKEREGQERAQQQAKEREGQQRQQEAQALKNEQHQQEEQQRKSQHDQDKQRQNQQPQEQAQERENQRRQQAPERQNEERALERGQPQPGMMPERGANREMDRNPMNGPGNLREYNPEFGARNGEPNGRPGPGNIGGNGRGAFGQRPSTPPPLRGMNRVPFNKTGQAPYVPPNLNPAQQAQANTAQQHMQQSLYAVPASQAPQNYASVQAAQNAGYMNNYPATIGNQPVTINTGNTYVNPVPQNNWPSWAQSAGPGWGFSTGLMLGAMASRLNWLHWGWPGYYGPKPSGFMFQNGYVPTPWFYVPWMNQWRQPGQMAYAMGGPPPEYTMPITVEAVEPVRTMVPDNFGIMVPQMINQVFMYNAYYYPQFGRWGYLNRHGYFVWVNPQMAVEPILPPLEPQ